MAADTITILPHVAVSRVEEMPEAPVLEFKRSIEAEGLEVAVDTRSSGPYAGVEWLMPTLVILFIARKYFDAFFSEMGKDHYHLLKGAAKKLANSMFAADAPHVRLVGTRGKVDATNRFSFAFSIVAEGQDGLRIKLLLQQDLSDSARETAVSAFLEFLHQYHAMTLDGGTEAKLEAAQVLGNTLLLAYDYDTSELEIIAPRAKRGSQP